MLILEGPDLSGKTTLLRDVMAEIGRRRWSRRYGWGRPHTHHHGKPGPDHDYEAEYLGAAGDHSCVATDRFALSELVYGPRLRGQVSPKVTSHLLRRAARMILDRGGLQVLVSADNPTINRRLAVRGEDPHAKNVWAYNALLHDYGVELDRSLSMGRPGLPTVTVDTSDDTPEVYRLTIDSLMEAWQLNLERAKAVAKMAPGGTGALHPRLLFVGSEGLDHPILTSILDDALLGERWLRFMPLDAVTHDAVAWLAPRMVFALDGPSADRLGSMPIECRPLVIDYSAPGKSVETLRAFAWRVA